MEKSKFTPLYEAFRLKLVELRKASGMSQRNFAEKLRSPRTIVERIEVGQRRVDVVELYWMCNALGLDSEKVFREIAKLLKAKDRVRKSRQVR